MISYKRIAEIGLMSDDDLVKRYYVVEQYKQTEDTEDELNAILFEMESRELPRP